jgi:DNA-binding MurR/RpiR family transcriptional regulator
MDAAHLQAIAAMLAAAGGFVGVVLTVLGRRHAEIQRLERRLTRIGKRIKALEKSAGKP